MLECWLSVHRRAAGVVGGSPREGVAGSAAAVVVGARSHCSAVAVGAVFPPRHVRGLQRRRLFFRAAFNVAAHVFAHLDRKWKL